MPTTEEFRNLITNKIDNCFQNSDSYNVVQGDTLSLRSSSKKSSEKINNQIQILRNIQDNLDKGSFKYLFIRTIKALAQIFIKQNKEININPNIIFSIVDKNKMNKKQIQKQIQKQQIPEEETYKNLMMQIATLQYKPIKEIAYGFLEMSGKNIAETIIKSCGKNQNEKKFCEYFFNNPIVGIPSNQQFPILFKVLCCLCIYISKNYDKHVGFDEDISSSIYSDKNLGHLTLDDEEKEYISIVIKYAYKITSLVSNENGNRQNGIIFTSILYVLSGFYNIDLQSGNDDQDKFYKDIDYNIKDGNNIVAYYTAAKNFYDANETIGVPGNVGTTNAVINDIILNTTYTNAQNNDTSTNRLILAKHLNILSAIQLVTLCLNNDIGIDILQRIVFNNSLNTGRGEDNPLYDPNIYELFKTQYNKLL